MAASFLCAQEPRRAPRKTSGCIRRWDGCRMDAFFCVRQADFLRKSYLDFKENPRRLARKNASDGVRIASGCTPYRTGAKNWGWKGRRPKAGSRLPRPRTHPAPVFSPVRRFSPCSLRVMLRAIAVAYLLSSSAMRRTASRSNLTRSSYSGFRCAAPYPAAVFTRTGPAAVSTVSEDGVR